MEAHDIDRRLYPRVPYGAYVEDISHEGNLGFYLSRNLSQGGLLLQTDEGSTPPVGSQVRLRLIVENEVRPLTVNGQVVRQSPNPGGGVLFAVKFEGLDRSTVNYLRELVTDLATSA